MKSLNALFITALTAFAVFVGCAENKKDDNKDQEVNDVAVQYNFCVQNRGDTCNKLRPMNSMSLDEFRGAGRTNTATGWGYQQRQAYYGQQQYFNDPYRTGAVYGGPVQQTLLDAYFNYLKNSLSKEDLKAFSTQLNWVGQGGDYDLRTGNSF